MKQKQFDLSIDNPLLREAKRAFDACLKYGIEKAISSGANEGSVTLTVKYEIADAVDQLTAETYKAPIIVFKAAYNVPQKDGFDGVADSCRLLMNGSRDSYMLVGNQVTMDDLMQGQEGD